MDVGHFCHPAQMCGQKAGDQVLEGDSEDSVGGVGWLGEVLYHLWQGGCPL